MTSINSTASNAYYQLLNQNSTAQTGTVTSLADALSASADDGSSSTDSSAYLMDLSPAAQAYLSSNSTATATSAAATSSTDSSTGFTLSETQQKQVDAILEKYKDAPYTQATFNQIQSDLKSAGLGTDALSAQDQIKSFNSTQVLIGYLDGSDTSTTPVQTAADEQTKATNFTQDLLSQWKNISTTTADPAAPIS